MVRETTPGGFPMEAVAVTAEAIEVTIAQDGIVLVDWWASWCGPCQMFAPIFEDAAAQHPDVVLVGRGVYPSNLNVVDDVRRRLRRAAGQVQALDRMLADGRECREVVMQISAATKALEQAGFKRIAAGLTYCVERPEEAEADGYALEDVERMFLKLA